MIGQFIQLVPRTLAVFVGGFSLLNVLIGFWNPGFDANIWWIDTRALGAQLASFLLLAYGAVLLFFGFDIEITGPAFRLPGLQIWNAIRRWRNRYRRVAYLLLLLLSGLVLAIIGLNVITFYKLLHFRIQSRFGLPFSLWIALMAATIALSILRQKPWAQNPGPARL
ncbi:MAG: hypothetical protein KDK39_19000, partial [Leptospiraceae bacterium]|nr:hypothetical protein [Leptospiraceae bacterium]